jgi:hypothetical protein
MLLTGAVLNPPNSRLKHSHVARVSLLARGEMIKALVALHRDKLPRSVPQVDAAPAVESAKPVTKGLAWLMLGCHD